MRDLAVAVVLIAWVALFGLLIVVPWSVIRVVNGLLKADVEAITGRWAAPIAGYRRLPAEREQRDTRCGSAKPRERRLRQVACTAIRVRR